MKKLSRKLHKGYSVTLMPSCFSLLKSLFLFTSNQPICSKTKLLQGSVTEHTSHTQSYFPSKMRTGILPFKSHAPQGSACLVTQNYFNSHIHLIFRAASQNPVVITHMGFFQYADYVNYFKEIYCHPSFLRMQSVFRFSAKIILLLSHASVFISLQKPILNTSAYFVSYVFFLHVNVLRNTHFAQKTLFSLVFSLSFDFHMTSLSRIKNFKNPLVYGNFLQCNSSMAILSYQFPLSVFCCFLDCVVLSTGAF